MLAKRTLTNRGIDALQAAPLGKRQLVWDALIPGFAVRVTDKGAKAFVLVARFPGSPTQLPGRLGELVQSRSMMLAQGQGNGLA